MNDASTPPPGKPPRNPQKLSPILGLPVDDLPAPLVAADRPAATMRLSVIVPARNEQANITGCLATLVTQSDEHFQLGREWEIVIVDDASTDTTRELAEGVAADQAGVLVLDAPALQLRGSGRVFNGKTNACWFAAQQAQGQWLLFTDADTLHEPGDLLRALYEAEKHKVALLSYSPRQVVSGVVQRALMPLVFSELAVVYPPAEVNDPARRVAAANGQFVLVEREIYFAVGGHKAVGRDILEDVALAVNVKRAAARHGLQGIRLRYAPDALATRMYAGVGDMMEGWEKNLALLFPHALTLACWRLLDIALFLLPLILVPLHYLVLWQQAAIVAIWARTLLRFYRRVARSNFSVVDCAISPLALPIFVYLLVRSWMNHRLFHQVTWKGREYKQ